MTTVQDLLRHRGIDPVDARALLQYQLQVSHAWLITHAQDPLDDAQVAKLLALFGRRLAGEPVAYLTGSREFFSLPFHVTPAVLIPRPETELLVELALARLPPRQAARILDLGTGSGIIATTLAHHRPLLSALAIDSSDAALAVAARNAALHAPGRVSVRLSDWYSAITPQERFDLIVSNPPYIVAGDSHLAQGDLRFEPVSALTDHADGLSAIRIIVSGAARHLLPGGWLLFEHGYDQGAASRQLMLDAGYADVHSERDLAGIERVTLGRLP